MLTTLSFVIAATERLTSENAYQATPLALRVSRAMAPNAASRRALMPDECRDAPVATAVSARGDRPRRVDARAGTSARGYQILPAIDVRPIDGLALQPIHGLEAAVGLDNRQEDLVHALIVVGTECERDAA